MAGRACVRWLHRPLTGTASGGQDAVSSPWLYLAPRRGKPASEAVLSYVGMDSHIAVKCAARNGERLMGEPTDHGSPKAYRSENDLASLMAVFYRSGPTLGGY